MKAKRLKPLFLWKRRIQTDKIDFWLEHFRSPQDLIRISVAQKPQSPCALLTFCCPTRSKAEQLQKLYRGQIERLESSSWLQPPARCFSFAPYFCVSSTALPSSSLPIIHIPAGLAFGTGEHSTTAMCLRHLTRFLPSPHARMLDIGTGSGVLALAGALLGYQVTAIDNDPASIREARSNAIANSHIPSVTWKKADLKTFTSSTAYDLITANLYADCICSNIKQLRKLLKPQGTLILSGILGFQADELIDKLSSHGLQTIRKTSRGKWVSLQLIHIVDYT